MEKGGGGGGAALVRSKEIVMGFPSVVYFFYIYHLYLYFINLQSKYQIKKHKNS